MPASRKETKPARRMPAAKVQPKDRKQEAIDLVLETTTALAAERGDTAKLWGSMIKQTLKRRHPSFSESFYGFPSFNELLEEAQTRGYLKLELDDKSGGYIIQSVTSWLQLVARTDELSVRAEESSKCNDPAMTVGALGRSSLRWLPLLTLGAPPAGQARLMRFDQSEDDWHCSVCGGSASLVPP